MRARNAGDRIAPALDAIFTDRCPDLMIPGPCQPTNRVLAAMHHDVVAHYGHAWSGLFHEVHDLAKVVLNAPYTYLLPGSGTLAIETAMLNLFSAGERVLIPDTGYFGKRLASIARTLGLKVDTIAIPAGLAVNVDVVRKRLTGIDGLVVAHVESSTGVRHPVKALADAATEVGAICVVDAVASVGGEEISIADMGIDALATASQKGIGAPPGVGIVALSERGYQHVHTCRRFRRGWYTDLRVWDREKTLNADWEPHPVTMPTNLILALATAFSDLLDEGVTQAVSRRARLASSCRSQLKSVGIYPAQDEEVAANLVLVMRAKNAEKLRREVLASAQIAIAGGLTTSESETVRIGLLGAHSNDDSVRRLMSALKRARSNT